MNDNLFSIRDYIIIVTGSKRGNGKALTEGLIKAGAVVYGLDKDNENETIATNLFSRKCDLSNNSSFNKICEEIFKKHNRIDSLVNNAGVSFPQKDGELYDKTKWDKTLDINLKAVFSCTQTVCSYMSLSGKGSIVNITSLSAELGFPNNPAYVASKGGLKMLTKAFARDWGRKGGIRFNNLGPGYIITEMTENSYNDPITRDQREKNIMLGRWGQPKDLVGPCIFLISKASSYITGQDLYVDGGWIANGLPYE